MLRYTHKNKKAQMELMGLAIVVLLIVLGMFFAIKYTLQEPPEIKKSYATTEIATNFVNTLLSTSTDECKSLTTMKDLIGDCAVNGLEPPQPGLKKKCDDEDKTYCEAAGEILDDITEKTLDEWGKSYVLKVYGKTDYFQKGNCKEGEERGKAGLFYIPTKYETVAVRLDICS